MKRILIFIMLLLTMVVQIYAKPAKRIKTTLVQPNGSTITAIAAGDEFCHYFIDFNTGARLKKAENGEWIKMTLEEITLQDNEAIGKRINRKPEKETAYGIATEGDNTHLLLLVEFENHKFSEIGTKDHFDKMANSDDYNYNGAMGSVKQYFKDQSLGKYNPTFDVIGPVCMDTTYQYYGARDSRIAELVSDAVTKAYEGGLIEDLSKYDNDNDGFVDLIYVITAGYSQAEDPDKNSKWPWPHKWNTKTKKFGDTYISNYAFSTELVGIEFDGEPVIDGIGSMAHEFGHALGLPDMYNTGNKSGCYGMDYWDVMDAGCYNGDGCVPPSYTAHERAFLGWCELDTLPLNETITLEPFGLGNKAYVMYNPENKNEYLTFEYHTQDGKWDEFWGAYGLQGMLVIHTDYNKFNWDQNTVNTDPDHQRVTVLPADGELIPMDMYSDGLVSGNDWYYSFVSDIFPGYKNVKLLNNFNPTFRWFNGPIISTKIKGIRENDKSSVTFTVSTPNQEEAIDFITIDDNSVEVFNMNGVLKGSNPNQIEDRGLFIVKNKSGKSSIISK